MNLHGIASLAVTGILGAIPLGGEYCERVALAKQAVSADAQSSRNAIEGLRAKGAPGLDALLAEFDRASNKTRFREAIDKVAGQKDACYSRLFWYTDLNEAMKRAKGQNKPILSLRLLGRLDEELSCANSRFFRTALYANEEISKLLRERFILHWESVRPVPKITVDFGDGRKLERTIAGNSIHYVLNADGTLRDALPGLYSPKAFREQLTQNLGYGAPNLDPETVRNAHQVQVASLERQILSELEKVGATDAEKRCAPALSDSLLNKIAALHSGESRMDGHSAALFYEKYPNAEVAGRVTVSKCLEEAPALRAVRNFERSMSLDSVRNELVLHRTIHQWFVEGFMENDLKTVNDRVYAELFLSPNDDPWLGLVPEDCYSGIPNEGKVVVK